MAYTSKICNPSPWDVELEYERGIVINIPAFGEAQLTMQQMDDYRPEKPGAEAISEVLDTHGIFLLDVDRPYNNQALEALTRMRNKKDHIAKDMVTTAQGLAARQNISYSDEAFDNILNQMGVNALKAQVSELEELIEQFRDVTKPETQSQVQTYDPALTVYTHPGKPRQFPSEAAKGFFLKKHPEMVETETLYREEMQAEIDRTEALTLTGQERI